MFSIVASIRPAPWMGSHVLRGIGARLRAFDHVLCAPGQLLVTVPGLGTVLLTESRTLLRVDLIVGSEDSAARACAVLLRQVDTDDVSISWMRDDSLYPHL